MFVHYDKCIVSTTLVRIENSMAYIVDVYVLSLVRVEVLYDKRFCYFSIHA